MDPALTVYAFEPNWNLVRQMIGQLPNFVVFPMAVSERDGVSDFFLNAEDEASSLLDFDPEGLQRWNGGESLRIESKIAVPTIRLDTFMRDMNIQTVDYLKIDAQGADFTVIRSAGARLNDIRKIKLEVDITPVHLYQGSAGREEVAAHMEERGFVLNGAEVQSLGQEENLTFVQRTRPD
jgi:FkbM family methyltransferase